MNKAVKIVNIIGFIVCILMSLFMVSLLIEMINMHLHPEGINLTNAVVLVMSIIGYVAIAVLAIPLIILLIKYKFKNNRLFFYSYLFTLILNTVNILVAIIFSR